MKVLVAPLDWGLGHATRCIPVITQLIQEGHAVIITADGSSGELLKQEFPTAPFIPLRGYGVKYYTGLSMSLSMLIQLPKIISRILIEHHQLKTIIHKYEIDKVISDCRYGLWNKNVHSVFITHQLMIKCPKALRWLEPFLHFINKQLITKFEECWIPDDENNLSGDLSHKYSLPSNAKFIGLLSRWKGYTPASKNKSFDLVAIISGPEPQRTRFEELLISKLSSVKIKSLIVQGKPGSSVQKKISSGLTIVPHLLQQQLLEIVSGSDYVVCRSGYSSIMDLVTIRKNAILIPTPGQTEQIYLAEYLQRKKLFFSIKQNDFDLEKAINESKNFSVMNTVK